jgi:transketolase
MALAEKLLAAEFNRPGFDVVNHRTYAFLGDGCLMEGISHEVCSLAGTLRLGKLICFYDDNGISIDGGVDGWFTDDTPARFRAYGWHVVAGVDGHKSEAIEAALRQAKAVSDQPSLICCKTVIGKGSPNKAGSHEAHGAPLGAEEVAATRARLGWGHAPFAVPSKIRDAWDARGRGARFEARWIETLHSYAQRHPDLAREFRRRTQGELPADWPAISTSLIRAAVSKTANLATRKASQNVIEQMGPVVPELLGGSADLTSSNLTNWSGSTDVSATRAGNYVRFGVREFGMSAIANGIMLHGGFIAYCGTFLTFSDYARNALRMAALMGIGTIFIFTHDSIGLGEDGPTHQAVEHAASLRIIPNMDVWRPGDSVETAAAWAASIERRDGPTSLLLSRQSLPFQPRLPDALAAIRRGGYILIEPASTPTAVIIATGSEVAIAVGAQTLLAREDIPVRVVSMPSTTTFDRQDPAYRAHVLPRALPAVAVEAGVSDFWRKYVGRSGAIVGIDRFGESAPASELFRHFGLTAEHVAEAVKSLKSVRAG